jgi:arabinan endo-1,5-alpha-L-arabinosidase
MEDKRQLAAGEKRHFRPPGWAPFHFSVAIGEAGESDQEGYVFEVTGPDPQTQENKTSRYRLPGRDHHAYLDLYEQLATDFGLRVPQNRRPAVAPTFNAAFTAVLKENLAPGMLYGYGDPAVIRVQDGFGGAGTRYYLLTTSNDAPDSFPILRSLNLVDWEFLDYVFPRGQKPAWAAEGEMVSDYWAPEMHQIKDEFRVYFVARDRHTRELCIGMARSASPEGPFLADAAPLVKGNVIDPHVFVAENGTSYLYWKEDNNDLWPGRLNDLLYHNPAFIPELFPEKEDQLTACFIHALWPWARSLEPMERFLAQQVFIEAVIARYATFYEHLENFSKGQPGQVQQEIRAVLAAMRTPVFAQQLSENGSELVGSPTKIIENDLAWEAHLVEGIWVTRQGRKYYLFYAGNDFSTDQYGIGVAVADSPLGPYQKMPRPFLQSTAAWWAPGHPSVVTGPDEKPHLFLHGFFPGQAGYKQFRALLSVPLHFEDHQVSFRDPG